jgi:hypothetical protein
MLVFNKYFYKKEVKVVLWRPCRCPKRLHLPNQREYYASKTLNDAQVNYATTEKELLAVVLAFKKFRSYIVNLKVIMYTEHAGIKYLLSKKDAMPHLIR